MTDEADLREKIARIILGAKPDASCTEERFDTKGWRDALARADLVSALSPLKGGWEDLATHVPTSRLKPGRARFKPNGTEATVVAVHGPTAWIVEVPGSTGYLGHAVDFENLPEVAQ